MLSKVEREKTFIISGANLLVVTAVDQEKRVGVIFTLLTVYSIKPSPNQSIIQPNPR